MSDLVPSGSTLSLNWLFQRKLWLSFNMIPTSHVHFYSRKRLNRQVKLKPWTFTSFKFEWCSKILSTASDCIILKALSTSLQRFCYKCYRQYPPLSPEIISGLPFTAHLPAHYQLSDHNLPVDDVIKTSTSVRNCHIKTLNWAGNLRFLLIILSWRQLIYNSVEIHSCISHCNILQHHSEPRCIIEINNCLNWGLTLLFHSFYLSVRSKILFTHQYITKSRAWLH